MRWNDWAREYGSMALNRVASARQGTALAASPARIIMPRHEQDVYVFIVLGFVPAPRPYQGFRLNDRSAD